LTWDGLAIWLWLAAGAFGALAVGYTIGRRRSGAPASAPSGSELYALAARLEDFYRASAHPADLRHDPSFERCVQLLTRDTYTGEQLLAYLSGDNTLIACIAACALQRRTDGPELCERALASAGRHRAWSLYFTLQYLASAVAAERPLVGRVLARIDADSGWLAEPSRSFLCEFAAQRARQGEVPAFGAEIASLSEERAEELAALLEAYGAELGGTLVEDFARQRARHIDRNFLGSLGTLWGERELSAARAIIEHGALSALLADMEPLLAADPPRPVLLVGEPGVGKSTASALVALHLHEQGYEIFEAGHSELVAGQTYIGEFEKQLRTLIDALGGGRRVLWLLRDFAALSYSGRHAYSPISALDVLLPHLERGELRLVGCCTPGALDQLAQQKPRILNALSVQRVDPLDMPRTAQLARVWLDRHGATHEDREALLRECTQLAQQYLSERATPGNLLSLLALARHTALARDPAAGSALTLDDVIGALAQQTGLPRAMLDERETLDLDGLRRLLARRVIEQHEAVDCLVERVAMIKSGLTDPRRPYGVFLFVGPTGTGKTEIARTLAEFLFGSPERMIRVDMSELQSAESFDRLLGSGETERGFALVDRIREKPFSVILLDEFEKAHERVWDVFLQVFDDGRLTDRRGRTADFRHSIVILTSNLGALAHGSGTQPGFARGRMEFSERQVQRALQASFRQELVNRIDQIVIFRPLRREAMRAILNQELNSVFQRRGLRSRSWAVEWDDAALEFLLEAGFSEELGARPLKRAIERHLLAPLALTIVGHQHPEGDQFLFVSSTDGRLVVEFVDPDAPDVDPLAAARQAASESTTLSLRSIALDARGTASELGILAKVYDELCARVHADDWSARRKRALEATGSSEFWQSAERFDVLGQVEYQDRIDSALRRAGSLLRRLDGGQESQRHVYPPHLVRTLAHNLYLLQTACEDVQHGRPRDAFLMVEARVDGVLDAVELRAFAAELSGMYLRWGERRRMRLDVIEEPASADAPYRMVAAVTGFGAYSILASEAGLHVLETPGAQPRSFLRSAIHVRVAAWTGSAATGRGEALRRDARRALEASSDPEIAIVRRYRRAPSPLVRDSARGWRTGRIDQVLAGDFDLMEP
jgi:ATP-dependent Clp protease ATP-binding subunit ClpC